MANSSRLAVVVLGMHRSGTSAVAGAAIRLGLARPSTPSLPTPNNPTGFHESVPIVQLNHLVLNAVGRDWYHCLSFDPEMLDDAARAAAFERCVGILRREFGDAGSFVVKDPLLCLTLPIWLPALRELGAAVSVLLVVRHPEEVARSVFRRDRLPESDTVAVWLHHMIEAERITRGMPRAAVLYTDLLHDWRACMARAGRIANIAWPAPEALSRGDGADVVVRWLRHHVAVTNVAAVGLPPIRELVDEAWQALRLLADDPASALARARLDDVRSRFASWRNATRDR